DARRHRPLWFPPAAAEGHRRGGARGEEGRRPRQGARRVRSGRAVPLRDRSRRLRIRDLVRAADADGSETASRAASPPAPRFSACAVAQLFEGPSTTTLSTTEDTEEQTASMADKILHAADEAWRPRRGSCARDPLAALG